MFYAFYLASAIAQRVLSIFLSGVKVLKFEVIEGFYKNQIVEESK